VDRNQRQEDREWQGVSGDDGDEAVMAHCRA